MTSQAAAAAFAENSERPPEGADPAEGATPAPPEAAHGEAAAMTGGRVLDVQTVREGERQAFHVKVLLDDGRVQLIELGGEPHDTPDSNDK